MTATASQHARTKTAYHVLSFCFVTLLLVLVRETNGFTVYPTSKFLLKNDCNQLSSPRQNFSPSPLFCQLLGINSARDSEFAWTWPGFCERGGGTDVHKHGWGMAYYIGQGLRQFHDVEAASTSPLAQFLGSQPIKTRNLLAHIRYATSGTVSLANVHPFSREMWAFNWCFCHNGQVPLFDEHPDHWLGDIPGERFYYPVGETDSEATFCAILNALRAEFDTHMPTLPVLYEKLKSLCKEIVDYNPDGTILNFLLTCGPHVLWVYSWPGSRPGSDVWNGLHYAVRSKEVQVGDEDLAVDVAITCKREERGPNCNNICIVATKPLTDDEDWVELKPGELILLDEGVPQVTTVDLFRVELQGHGLDNAGKVLHPPRLEEDMRRYEVNADFFAGGGI